METVGSDPVRIATERDERNKVADATGQWRDDRTAVWTRGANELHSGRAIKKDGRSGAERRMGEEREIRDRMVESPAAKGAEDDHLVGARGNGGGDGQLRVRRVFVGGDEIDRHATGAQRVELFGIDRVTVAYPAVDAQAQPSRVPGAAVGRHDDGDVV